MNPRTRFLLPAIVFLIGGSGVAHGQSRSGTTIQLMSAASMTRIGIQSWSSGGAGVAEEGLVSAAFTNPAGLDPERITLYGEAGIRTTANWLLDIDYDGQLIVPAYLSVSFPLQAWHIGVGYMDFYDSRIAINNIAVTTPNFPEGTGNFFDAERTVRTHTFFGSADYRPSGDLSLGATLGLTDATLSDRVAAITASGSGLGMIAILGAIVRPNPSLSIGSKFTVASTVNITAGYNLQSALPGPRGTVLIPEAFTYSTAFPLTAEAGIGWNITPAAELLASLEYQGWSKVSESFNNELQYHLGVLLALSPVISLRGGFFTQKEPVRETQDYFTENFLTAGLEFLAFENCILTASILDSHLLTNSPSVPSLYGRNLNFRQSYASLGVAYRP
jgi:hypothetical protein